MANKKVTENNGIYTDDNGNWVDMNELTNTNSGSISWRNSVGKSIKFFYDGINGIIKIVKKVDRQKSIIEYEEKQFEIYNHSILTCNLSTVIGKRRKPEKDFIYNIGEEISNSHSTIKIISHYKENGRMYYKYQCKKCGRIGSVAQSRLLQKCGCKVCGKTSCIPGINDLQTMRPDLAKFCVNPEDAKNVSYQSKKKIEWRCPNCGNKQKNEIKYVTKCGYVPCKKCNDCMSYPNKFMYSLLEQLNLDFETEKTFEWSDGKIYDDYIEYDSLKIIVENHGIQHYEKRLNKNARDTRDEHENDKLKESLALNNGIDKYFQIDCRKSERDYIKKSIIESGLLDVFGVNEYLIDWNLCAENATKSVIKKIADYYNNNKLTSQYDISKRFHIHKSTVCKYINIAIELGLIDYEYYPTRLAKEKMYIACQYYEKHKPISIEKIAKDLHHIYGDGYSYGRVHDYIKQGNALGICNYEKNVQMPKKINQYDVDMNFIRQFNSVKEAALYMNGKENTLYTVIYNNKPAYGYIWKYAL